MSNLAILLLIVFIISIIGIFLTLRNQKKHTH